MNITWEPSALRDMRRLDPPVARQVRDALQRYASTGHGDVRRLHDSHGVCRLRSGDWRVRCVRRGDCLHVLAVQHRSDAYR